MTEIRGHMVPECDAEALQAAGQTVRYQLSRLPSPAVPGSLLHTIAGAVFDDGNLLLVRPTALPDPPAEGAVTLGPVGLHTVNPVTGATQSSPTHPAVLPWRSQPVAGGGQRLYAEQLTAWLTGGPLGDRDLILETGHADLPDPSQPPVWLPTSAGSYDLSSGRRLADLSSLAPTTGANLLAGGRTLTAIHRDGTRCQLLRVDPTTATIDLLTTYTTTTATTVFPGQPALPTQT